MEREKMEGQQVGALPPAEDRATAVEPVPVSPLRDGIPSASVDIWIAALLGHSPDGESMLRVAAGNTEAEALGATVLAMGPGELIGGKVTHRVAGIITAKGMPCLHENSCSEVEPRSGGSPVGSEADAPGKADHAPK